MVLCQVVSHERLPTVLVDALQDLLQLASITPKFALEEAYLVCCCIPKARKEREESASH